jgi:hypothetical protein
LLSKCIGTIIGFRQFFYNGREISLQISTTKKEQKNRGKKKEQSITFSFIRIFTVPNKLGTDAKKILDHRLLTKKRKQRENGGMRKIW